MKCSILMSILLAFGLHVSSQCSHNNEKMGLLKDGKPTKNSKGLTWAEAKPLVHAFYDDSLSCESCYHSMPNDRCTCVSCIGTGICCTLFTSCVAALSYVQYQYDKMYKCQAWCDRGRQGLGWCTPEQKCFDTLSECETACDPSGNAYSISRTLIIGGFVVTGLVGVSMCCVPCRYLIKYCKGRFISKMRRPESLADIERKYRGREQDLLDADDIENVLRPVLNSYDWLTDELNDEQKAAFDSL
jgi:hypothetical protein